MSDPIEQIPFGSCVQDDPDTSTVPPTDILATIEVPIVDVDPETFNSMRTKIDLYNSNFMPTEPYENQTLFLAPDIDSKTSQELENANLFLDDNNLFDKVNSQKHASKRKRNNERCKEYRKRR